MDDLLDIPAFALARRIRSKDVSSLEIVEAFLRRIQAANPRLNAVVQLAAEHARDAAARADAELARGRVRGPLHGVPFTAKDVFETQGLVSAAGIPERAGYVPLQDATVIARLRGAGAILLGKTNCPPGGGGGESDNPVYGRTNNPYDLERTPGGSSGGEAAVQAAGASPLGLGSDSGGSIRFPAHCCGVAGLKPTHGRVPNTGTFNHPGGLTDPRTQIGPLSRFVEDLGPALAILAGPDWHDSGVIPVPAADLDAVEIGGLRVAYFADDGVRSPTPETEATLRAVATVIGEAGVDVEERRPKDIDAAWDISLRYWRESELTGAEREGLMQDWDAFRSRMLAFMRRYDALLCPVCWCPAPPHGAVRAMDFSYTLPYSLTGYPCVSVRAGTSPEGLPIGVQVVARPWREDVALAVARHVEAVFGGWRRP